MYTVHLLNKNKDTLYEILFVKRFTDQFFTPSIFETAFSTLALQAAQDIPVTLNCFIFPPPKLSIGILI